MYLVYGSILAAAWFVMVNVAISLLVWSAIDRISSATAAWNPAARARMLLTCRLLPTIGSIGFVAGIFIPSFGKFEPRNFDEGFGLVTTTMAVGGCGLLLSAAYRAAQAIRESERRMAALICEGKPIELGMENVRTLCVDAKHPAMTLAGVIRPTLLVTRPLVDLLTREELTAALDHERGHRRSWDNLKRLAIRSCADALSWFPASLRLEQAWICSAEQAADRVAAQDASSGLALASALLKVARASLLPSSGTSRLTQSLEALAPGLQSPLVGGGGVVLQARVESLLEGTDSAARHSGTRHRRMTRLLAAVVLIAAGFVAVHAYAPVLESVHTATEVAVHHLP